MRRRTMNQTFEGMLKHSSLLRKQTLQLYNLRLGMKEISREDPLECVVEVHRSWKSIWEEELNEAELHIIMGTVEQRRLPQEAAFYVRAQRHKNTRLNEQKKESVPPRGDRKAQK